MMSVYSCPGAGPDACQSITIPPLEGCQNPPINLTTVTSRPLHAVLLEREVRGVDPPGLPQARLDELLAAFAPNAILTIEGTRSLALANPRGGRAPGVDDDVAVVL